LPYLLTIFLFVILFSLLFFARFVLFLWLAVVNTGWDSDCDCCSNYKVFYMYGCV